MMKRNILLIAILAAAAVLGAGYFLWDYAETPKPLVFSGTIQADHIHVGSKVGGRVLKVVAREGETVKAGEPLVLLEPHDLDASLAEAEATLHQAEARLALLNAGYRKEEIAATEAEMKEAQAELDELLSGPQRQDLEQAKAEWTAAKAQAERSHKLLERAAELSRRNLIARKDYDDAAAKAEESEQRRRAAQRRYETLLAGGSRPAEVERYRERIAETAARLRLLRSGFRKEEIAQARAAVDAARAKARWVRTQLDETVIKAPTDALVEKLDLEPGDLISGGKPVATLLRTGSLWVRAYLPQAQLRFAQPGTKATIRVDSYPDTDFSGVVRSIHRDDDPTLAKVPSREERALAVFQTEVLVSDPDNLLRPGMSADVIVPKAVVANASVRSEIRSD